MPGELVFVEGLAAAVTLDQTRHEQFRALEGREALAAAQALAAAADLPAVGRQPRIGHLGLDVAAEGTMHRLPRSDFSLVHRKAPAQLADLRSHALDDLLGALRIEHIGDPLRDLAHLGLAKATRGGSRRPEPQAARDRRRSRIVRHRVLVDGDVSVPRAASASLPVMSRPTRLTRNR
jgi:hypothetical protein